MTHIYVKTEIGISADGTIDQTGRTTSSVKHLYQSIFLNS